MIVANKVREASHILSLSQKNLIVQVSHYSILRSSCRRNADETRCGVGAKPILFGDSHWNCISHQVTCIQTSRRPALGQRGFVFLYHSFSSLTSM